MLPGLRVSRSLRLLPEYRSSALSTDVTACADSGCRFRRQCICTVAVGYTREGLSGISGAERPATSAFAVPDAQGAWFEHDLHALSAQQKAACEVLNPEKSHPYIEDMAMFLSPLPVVLEWHCVMCGRLFPGKKFCEACGTGIYCRAVCTKSVYSYQPDLFLDYEDAIA
jgi:hypothetical protein